MKRNQIHGFNFRKLVFNNALEHGNFGEYGLRMLSATGGTRLYQHGVWVPAVIDATG